MHTGIVRILTSLVLSSLCLTSVPAAVITLTATDAGFVTEMGGSAKGDGTISPADYNYSVGYEVHFADGSLSGPLAPMLR
jgi:hypothetical protein